MIVTYEVGFLDWQMARRGNWSLDLGYFLQGAQALQQLRMEVQIGGHDIAAEQGGLGVVEARDTPARLLHQQQPRGDVPGLQPSLPITIEPAGGDIGQVQGRGPEASDPGDALADLMQVLQELGVPRPAREGNAGSEDAVLQPLASGHPQAPLGPQPGALAPLGPEHLLGDRVVGHRGHHLTLAGDRIAPLQGDVDRELRDAVQEVGRAVQRVDDPAMLGVLALQLAAFLHQEAPVGPGARQFLEDDLLCLAIGVGNEIRRPLHGHLQVLHLAEIADERAPRLHRGLGHHVEQG